jgi:hypothetical protein
MDVVEEVDDRRVADGSTRLTAFGEMRERCPALREVLLPDSIWQQFEDWHSCPDDEAAHRSILLLAFRRASLSCVTKPIHRYIVSSNGIRRGVRKQYIQDLRERWMLADDPSSGIGCPKSFEVALSNCSLRCGLRASHTKLWV